jgi:hypothetical protein
MFYIDEAKILKSLKTAIIRRISNPCVQLRWIENPQQ